MFVVSCVHSVAGQSTSPSSGRASWPALRMTNEHTTNPCSIAPYSAHKNPTPLTQDMIAYVDRFPKVFPNVLAFFVLPRAVLLDSDRGPPLSMSNQVGETLHGHDFQTGFGGKGANQVVLLPVP